MKTLAALLTVALGALFTATQADDNSPEPDLETLRFAPADYSPYDSRQFTPTTYPGVDWSALAPPVPRPHVAFPAVIRMPLAPSAPRD